MYKSVLILLAVIMGITVGIVSSRIFFSDASSTDQTDPQNFVEETLSQFLATLDQQYLLANTTTGYSTTLATDLSNTTSMLDSLGTFQGISTITPYSENPDADNSAVSLNTFFTIVAEFAEDSVVIYVELITENNGWKITAFTAQAQQLIVSRDVNFVGSARSPGFI